MKNFLFILPVLLLRQYSTQGFQSTFGGVTAYEINAKFLPPQDAACGYMLAIGKETRSKTLFIK